MRLLLIILILLIVVTAPAQQDTDHQYARALKDVLMDIEKKYDVRIKFVDSMVKGKW